MSFPASPARDQRPDQRQARTEPLPSDPAELEKIIRGQQNQLASDVDALVDLASPKNVAERTKSHLTQRAERTKADLTKRGRDAVLTPDGKPRTELLAAAGAGVAGLLSLVLAGVVRRRRRGNPRRKIEKAAKRGQKHARREDRARLQGKRQDRARTQRKRQDRARTQREER